MNIDRVGYRTFKDAEDLEDVKDMAKAWKESILEHRKTKCKDWNPDIIDWINKFFDLEE